MQGVPDPQLLQVRHEVQVCAREQRAGAEALQREIQKQAVQNLLYAGLLHLWLKMPVHPRPETAQQPTANLLLKKTIPAGAAHRRQKTLGIYEFRQRTAAKKPQLHRLIIYSNTIISYKNIRCRGTATPAALRSRS